MKPFDFKKEYKDLYAPKTMPEIITVPKANYIAVRGSGNPNEEGGAYKQAIGILFAVAYTIKMSYKLDYKIEGFYEYVVPPLEGLWWQEDADTVNYADKDSFQWISLLRLPEFVTEKDFAWAVAMASEKKKMDCSTAEFLTLDEGECVQILHKGPFDTEPESVAAMNEYLKQKGYMEDISDTRRHHEIYLTDARKTAPEKWKTVIRHPVRREKENNANI
ncbi:MAG: GyrI-like domain-containing protein [Lachnospiraceae bacterium]|nr:GyrI-like domain-containing protein [Lachnospiraceae bacterium]